MDTKIFIVKLGASSFTYPERNKDMEYLAFQNEIRGGSRDFKKGDSLCRLTWLADEENFRFQMV